MRCLLQVLGCNLDVHVPAAAVTLIPSSATRILPLMLRRLPEQCNVTLLCKGKGEGGGGGTELQLLLRELLLVESAVYAKRVKTDRKQDTSHVTRHTRHTSHVT